MCADLFHFAPPDPLSTFVYPALCLVKLACRGLSHRHPCPLVSSWFPGTESLVGDGKGDLSGIPPRAALSLGGV